MASVNVPATIHDIISARVDRLAESLKQTLQPAAVVGRRFAVPLLARVVDSPGDLENRLGNLHALDFVFPSGLPSEAYSFKHALTQDVVYANLLERRRRQYHAAVGAALEELYAERIDDIVEVLAYHFERAGQGEKAVDYAILAAEKAQRRWANTEALAHFETALRRLASMPDTRENQLRRIDAIVKQAEVKFALGRHAEHIEALEAIRELVETVADPPRRASWFYWVGFLHSLTGARPETSIAYCRQAAEIADRHGLQEIGAFAGCCLTHVHALAGNLREAIEAGERALATFEARGNVWWACRTLWQLSTAALGLGEWDLSLAYCSRALHHGQAVNDMRLKVVGWWRTGSTHVQRGDLKAGLQCCQEALALSPSAFDIATIKAVRGYALVKGGEMTAGTAELEEARSWFEQAHLRYSHELVALRLAEALLLQGQRERARRLAEDVLATSRSLGYRHLEGMAARLLGASLSIEAPATARAHLDVATAVLEEVGARNEVARSLVSRAELELDAGDLMGARRLLQRALVIFEALKTLDEVPRVRETLASLTD